MRRALALTLLLAGCPQSESAPEPESESQAEAEAESEAEPQSEPEPESPADALARGVWEAAGGEDLEEVAQLDFRFVVTDAGETVFEAAHRWDRRGDRDRVSWTDREGALHEAIVSLTDRSACGHVDGTPAPDREALAEAAYGRWVNDAYWLMLPLKVLDPGVERALLEPEGELRRLQLTFESVGLTPGDRYVLFIDDAGRIVRWDMFLEGSEPDAPPKGVTFEGHQPVGPLTLALDHRAEGEGERQILLRDVTAHEAVQGDAFAIRGCE